MEAGNLPGRGKYGKEVQTLPRLRPHRLPGIAA